MRITEAVAILASLLTYISVRPEHELDMEVMPSTKKKICCCTDLPTGEAKGSQQCFWSKVNWFDTGSGCNFFGKLNPWADRRHISGIFDRASMQFFLFDGSNDDDADKYGDLCESLNGKLYRGIEGSKDIKHHQFCDDLVTLKESCDQFPNSVGCAKPEEPQAHPDQPQVHPDEEPPASPDEEPQPEDGSPQEKTGGSPPPPSPPSPPPPKKENKGKKAPGPSPPPGLCAAQPAACEGEDIQFPAKGDGDPRLQESEQEEANCKKKLNAAKQLLKPFVQELNSYSSKDQWREDDTDKGTSKQKKALCNTLCAPWLERLESKETPKKGLQCKLLAGKTATSAEKKWCDKICKQGCEKKFKTKYVEKEDECS